MITGRPEWLYNRVRIANFGLRNARSFGGVEPAEGENLEWSPSIDGESIAYHNICPSKHSFSPEGLISVLNISCNSKRTLHPTWKLGSPIVVMMYTWHIVYLFLPRFQHKFLIGLLLVIAEVWDNEQLINKSALEDWTAIFHRVFFFFFNSDLLPCAKTKIASKSKVNFSLWPQPMIKWFLDHLIGNTYKLTKGTALHSGSQTIQFWSAGRTAWLKRSSYETNSLPTKNPASQCKVKVETSSHIPRFLIYRNYFVYEWQFNHSGPYHGAQWCS